MLERLRIAFAEVKTGNTAENLLMEIFQIIYYLYQAKKKLLKMYMAIYYMKSGNSKTSDPHRPLAKY